MANYLGPPLSMLSARRAPSPLSHSPLTHPASLPPISHPLHQRNTKLDHAQSALDHTSSNLSHTQFMRDGIKPITSTSTSSFGGSAGVVGTMGVVSPGKGVRKMGITFSSRGVEQIDVASSGDRAGHVNLASSIGGGPGQMSRASSGELIRQMGVTSLFGSVGQMGSPKSDELLIPETFQLPVHVLNSISTDGSSVTNLRSSSSTSSASNFVGLDHVSGHRLDHSPSHALDERALLGRARSHASSNTPLNDESKLCVCVVCAW